MGAGPQRRGCVGAGSWCGSLAKLGAGLTEAPLSLSKIVERLVEVLVAKSGHSVSQK